MQVKKFISCGNCDNGFIYMKDGVSKCSCLEAYQEKVRVLHFVNKSNIPLHVDSYSDLLITDYSLSHYRGPDINNNLYKIKKFISKFPTDERYKKRNLFFSGGFGTQKSTLLRYVGVQLLKKGCSVYYTLADTLIRELMAAGWDNEDLRVKWEKIIQCDCLLIDEMSEDKITTYKSGWQRKFFLPFLKRRIEDIRKSVIFASNSPINNIGEYFEGAIQDVIFREVADKGMIFEDNYEKLKDDFNPLSLWD